MQVITRYGVGATPERKMKLGGVSVTIVDGQPISFVGATDYLDAFLQSGIFNQQQYNSVYQLIRDYQIGCLYKWKIIRDYYHSCGLSTQDADSEREKARKDYAAAIKYNHEFTKLSNIAHLLLEHIGVYLPPAWKMQQLADRLTYYYKNNNDD
jgi:hypothetical protein